MSLAPRHRAQELYEVKIGCSCLVVQDWSDWFKGGGLSPNCRKGTIVVLFSSVPLVVSLRPSIVGGSMFLDLYLIDRLWEKGDFKTL